MFRVHIVFVTKESIRIGIAAFFMVEFIKINEWDENPETLKITT